MASVTSNAGNFTHFKPPKKREISRFFTVCLLRVKELPVLNREYSRFSGCSRQAAPALTLGLYFSLSNPTIAGEFRMARLVGYGMDDKYLVMN